MEHRARRGPDHLSPAPPSPVAAHTSATSDRRRLLTGLQHTGGQSSSPVAVAPGSERCESVRLRRRLKSPGADHGSSTTRSLDTPKPGGQPAGRRLEPPGLEQPVQPSAASTGTEPANQRHAIYLNGVQKARVLSNEFDGTQAYAVQIGDKPTTDVIVACNTMIGGVDPLRDHRLGQRRRRHRGREHHPRQPPGRVGAVRTGATTAAASTTRSTTAPAAMSALEERDPSPADPAQVAGLCAAGDGGSYVPPPISTQPEGDSGRRLRGPSSRCRGAGGRSPSRCGSSTVAPRASRRSPARSRRCHATAG